MEQEKLNEQFLTAASSGDIESAIDALSNGADLNAKSLKGNNALYMAATRNRYDFFEWLLEVTQKGNSVDLNNKNNTNDTVLLELVREGVDVKFISQLLDAGAQVDMLSRDGVTPLLQACANGKRDVIEVLLKHGGDPNLFVTENRTNPFLMAVAEADFEIVKLLEENGANINAVDTFGRNALLSALFKPTTYMRKHEKESHKELLDYLVGSPINLDYVAPSGITAIWLASLLGKNDLVVKLIEKGVDVDRWHQLSPDIGKHAVIHTLCKMGNPELVELVLSKGGKLSVKDEQGNMAEAYGFMNPKLRDIMLKYNADVNAELSIDSEDQNKVNVAPVFSQIVAEGDSSFELIEEMVKRGARVTSNDKQKDIFDPILMAVTSAAPKCVELFLSQPGVDINKQLNISQGLGDSATYLATICSDMTSNKIGGAMQQKKFYESLLKAQKENEKNGVVSSVVDKSTFDDIAKAIEGLDKVEASVKYGKKKIFDLLIEKGAALELENESGKTALFYCKDVEHVKWMQDAGANIFHQDSDGNNPLTYAILNANTVLIDYYKEQYLKTENLDNIFYRMSFSETDGYASQSALENGIIHFAGGDALKELLTPKKDEEFQRQYVDNINYQDEDGNTGLMVACANNAPFLASLYYKLGADVNVANNLGETPLMHAIASKNTQFIEYLVKNGADLNAQTNEGKSVLDFAIETDRLDILKVINSPKKEEKRPKP